MSEIKLNPCSACCGDAEVTVLTSTFYTEDCKGCGMRTGPYENKEQAVVAWNSIESKQSFRATLSLPVEALDLTSRSENCLKSENIYHISDLVLWSEKDLLKVPSLGLKSLNEIKMVLADRGLALGMKPAGPIKIKEPIQGKALLDEFAIAALPVAMKICQALEGSSEDYSGFLDRIAETAYELGASMLDQREKWHD